MEFLIFVFWLGLAGLCGYYADKRGRTGLGWALLAIVISPILAGLVLFIIPDLVREQEESELESKRQQEERQRQKDKERYQSEQNRYHEARISGIDFRNYIDRLQQLHSKKIISQQEFTTKKQTAIDGLKAKYIAENREDFLMELLPLLENGALSADEIAIIKRHIESRPIVIDADGELQLIN